jgi:hypothetical protein
MNGHLGHGEAISQIVEIDGLLLDEQIDDRLLALFPLHLALQLSLGWNQTEYNTKI